MLKLLSCIALFASLVVLTACPPSGPRPNGVGPAGNTPSATNANPRNGIRATFSLRPKCNVGEHIRTTRVLTGIDDSNPDATISYATREVYTQHILAVRDGLPSKVERTYESSRNSVGTPANMETEASPLDGEVLEMTQHAGGLSIRVIGGEVPEPVLQKLLLVGFDVALLPVREVGLGDVWEIDVAKNPELDAMLQAFGLSGKSNVLTAQLALVDDGVASITIDWKVTGDIGDAKALVFRLHGEMLYELESGLIREVSLNGGKRNANGETRNQIAMSIKRKITKGWYE